MRRVRLNPMPSLADYSAFERMLANPSKAYINLTNEVKKRGGWTEKIKKINQELVCILDGPYAGTYMFGRPNVSYLPEYKTELSYRGRGRPLYLWRLNQVIERLGDLPAIVLKFILEHEPGEATRFQKWMKDQASNRRKLEIALGRGGPRPETLDGELEEGWQNSPEALAEYHAYLRTIIAPASVEGVIKSLQREAEANIAELTENVRLYEADPMGLRDWQSKHVKTAMNIYLLSQVGGVDFKTVVEAIKAKPMRLKTFITGLSVPTRRPERARWARALMTTFSQEAAIKALYPNVEGAGFLTQVVGDRSPASIALVRYALNHYPSWIHVADKHSADVVTTRDWVDSETSVERPATRREQRIEGTHRILNMAATMMQMDVNTADFRRILENLNREEMVRLSDVIRMLNSDNTRAILAETDEGRRVIAHLTHRQWRELIRDHDRVAEAVNAAYERGEYVAASSVPAIERHYRRALAFNFPSGVRPLVLQSDFRGEHDAMGHCIDTHFGNRTSFYFSFVTPEGDRATLELSTRGQEVQFFAEHNTRPSAGAKKLLKEFYAMNKDNLAAMRTGGFPPPAPDVVDEEHFSGERAPARGNPFGRRRR